MTDPKSYSVSISVCVDYGLRTNKLNNDHTVLLRNNLTLRLRSICVPNAFRTRPKCVPNAFQNAFHFRSDNRLGYRHIRHVRYKKSLGMVLDEQLKWDKHNEVQCKKISNSIALLKRARPFVPRYTLIKMYNAIVLPHFNYCSTIWNDGSCSVINKLSKLQRRAVRIITSSTYDIRSSQILKDLNWKPIEVDL